MSKPTDTDASASPPAPAAVADLWRDALSDLGSALTALMKNPPAAKGGRAFNIGAVATSMTELAMNLGRQPAQLLEAQSNALRQWVDLWTSAWKPTKEGEAPIVAPARGDRRFHDAEWSENPYYRGIRDSYLLASRQLQDMVGIVDSMDPANKAMVDFLLEQYLNAVAPTNFPLTNPQVMRRTAETGGANLVAGFANLLQDASTGQGIVRRRTSDAFHKGVNIAATPGGVIFQNRLFQLIQYDPATPDVDKRPLLYVPPLVNKYYMIDLRPKSSLVRWLVEQGRTVFVISWVNPDESHRDCGVEDYVREGVIEALEAARRATGESTVDLFSFCLGGTLVALALAYLAAAKRADEVGSATLIGSMVDFSDMRAWSAFVHEAHLDALDEHLEKRGFIDSTELQQLFSAVRSNDLIWSAVVNHYLLNQEAPPSDLLYWFEDGARIPQAFLTSYNRTLLQENRLRDAGAMEVDGLEVRLSDVKTPIMIIALKDDHVSAWEAVYAGARLFGGPVEFMLGGSGHNAGVINPPAANKHGYWRNPALPATADEWLEGAEKMPGSWWPAWLDWLARRGAGERVPPRKVGDGELPVIEAAPGSYADTRY